MIKHIFALKYLLIIILGSSISSQALALKTDRDQPADIEADDIEFNFQKGTRTYLDNVLACLLYTSPSPRDGLLSRMPSSA